MTTAERRASPTTEIKVVEAKAGLVSQIIAGMLFIFGGAGMCWWGLSHEQHLFVYIGLGVALVGAMFLPSLFPIAKNIYITFLPNGIPFLGGRRSTDPKIEEFRSETPQFDPTQGGSDGQIR